MSRMNMALKKLNDMPPEEFKAFLEKHGYVIGKNPSTDVFDKDVIVNPTAGSDSLHVVFKSEH